MPCIVSGTFYRRAAPIVPKNNARSIACQKQRQANLSNKVVSISTAIGDCGVNFVV